MFSIVLDVVGDVKRKFLDFVGRECKGNLGI